MANSALTLDALRQMEIEQLIYQSKKKRSLIRPDRKNERNKNLNRGENQKKYATAILS